jgi:hypothetical protein
MPDYVLPGANSSKHINVLNLYFATGKAKHKAPTGFTNNAADFFSNF